VKCSDALRLDSFAIMLRVKPICGTKALEMISPPPTVLKECDTFCTVSVMMWSKSNMMDVSGCGSHYTDVIRSVMQNNISQLGHLCVLFFPPVATATSETNS